MTHAPRAYLDLLCIAALTLAAVVFALFLPPSSVTAPLRIAFGLAFVLVAPGYALAASLFPHRGDVGGIERLVMSLALSIVSVPLLGLVMNVTPWGIHLEAMTLGLATLTFLAVAVAALERALLPPGRAFYLPQDTGTLRNHLGLAASVAAVFVGVILTVQLLRPSALTTEFYVLGAEGRLGGYPTNVGAGDDFPVTLTVASHERRATSFSIRVPELGDQTLAVPTLQPGATWQRDVAFEAPPPPADDDRSKLTFELYRPGDTAPYRSLRLYFESAGP